MKFVLLCAAMLCGTLFAQQDTVSAALLDYSQADTTYLDDKPFSGISVSWWSNGSVSFYAPYQNGRPHGQSQYFWRNGKVAVIEHHQDGVPHGQSKHFWYNGKLRKSEQYQSGQLEGVVTEWHENGELRSEISYLNGVPDLMTAQYWHADGSIKPNLYAKLVGTWVSDTSGGTSNQLVLSIRSDGSWSGNLVEAETATRYHSDWYLTKSFVGLNEICFQLLGDPSDKLSVKWQNVYSVYLATEEEIYLIKDDESFLLIKQ